MDLQTSPQITRKSRYTFIIICSIITKKLKIFYPWPHLGIIKVIIKENLVGWWYTVNRTPKHDDVIKWKHFPHYWPFVRGIHRSPVKPTHKGQWRGTLMFSLICARINSWVNNGEAGDLGRNRAHFGVTVMKNLELRWPPFVSRDLSCFTTPSAWTFARSDDWGPQVQRTSRIKTRACDSILRNGPVKHAHYFFVKRTC